MPASAAADDLLRRSAEGDARAFRALYDLEAPRLKALARRITGSAAMAEDVLHDVFLALWRHPHRYDPARGTGRGWLTTLVRFGALEARRRHGREPLGATAADLPDEAPGPLADLLRSTDGIRLHACLAQLDDTRRRLIRRAFLDGLPHVALAAESHLPLGTVKSLIRRGLTQLKACLDQ